MNVEDYVVGLLDSLDPSLDCHVLGAGFPPIFDSGARRTAAEIVQHPFVIVMVGLRTTTNTAMLVDSIIENEIAGPMAQYNNTGIVIEWPSPAVVIARIPTGLVGTPTKLTDVLGNLAARIPQTLGDRNGAVVHCGVPHP